LSEQLLCRLSFDADLLRRLPHCLSEEHCYSQNSDHEFGKPKIRSEAVHSWQNKINHMTAHLF
uniref:Uncharacterized protein n=1 Tax=Romanomermis culicivorax TaxID=13658 RepID=A0A915KBT2_ROMCU